MKYRNRVDSHRDQCLAEEIERELHLALDIEPSPALLPLVRSRIEHLSPRPSLEWWIWGVPAAAVAMIALVVLIVSPRFSRTQISTATEFAEPRTLPAISTVTPSPSSLPRSDISARQERRAQPRRVSATQSAKPQANAAVVVRANEQLAWREFIAFASRVPIVIETAATVASSTLIESVQVAPVEVPAVAFEQQ